MAKREFYFFIFILLISLTTAFLLFHGRNSTEPKIQQEHVPTDSNLRTSMSAKHQNRRFQKKIETVESSPTIRDKSSPSPIYQPKDNVIEFKIIDGLAVAYGDLILGKPESDHSAQKGFYRAPDPELWESGVIPYWISQDVPRPERIEKALEYLRQRTRINFIPYEGQKDAVIFENTSEHCLSPLGKIGGIQPIKLSPQCQESEVLHEILHTLGLVHEQSRPDRDQFIEVIWDHIDEKFQTQFAKVPESFYEKLKDTPFDYRSIMLYSPQAFAKEPGMFTLKSKGNEPISPVEHGLSEQDLKRLYRLYPY